MTTHTQTWIIVLLLFFGIPAFAQEDKSHWTRELYTKIHHKNFRDAPLFEQKIDQSNPDYPLLNACLFFLSNEFRLENNKQPLVYSPQLETAAWHHSKKMLEDEFFSHLNPLDQRRETLELRAKLAGIRNPAMAENIAMRSRVRTSSTYLEVAESIFKQWINSEGQLANILSDKALQLGCGVYTDTVLWYATQCFQQDKLIVVTTGRDRLPDAIKEE